MSNVFPKPVRKLPATAGVVYAALEQAGPMTYDDLAAETGRARSSVENAISRLRECGVVESVPDPDEPCRKLHDTSPLVSDEGSQNLRRNPAD